MRWLDRAAATSAAFTANGNIQCGRVNKYGLCPLMVNGVSDGHHKAKIFLVARITIRSTRRMPSLRREQARNLAKTGEVFDHEAASACIERSGGNSLFWNIWHPMTSRIGAWLCAGPLT
jgi:hypothetical protein